MKKIIQKPPEDYNSSAKYYDPVLNPFVNHIRRSVTKWVILNQPENILDIGCGTGKQISLFPKNMKIIGVDLSLAMLQIAEKQVAGKCIRGDATNLPFRDNGFDLIISQFALHEKTMDTIFAELREIQRLLKPGGKLLVVDFDFPDKQTLYSRFLKWGIMLIEKLAGKEHFANYKVWMNHGGLEKILAKVGWNMQENHHFYCGNVRMIIWKKSKDK